MPKDLGLEVDDSPHVDRGAHVKRPRRHARVVVLLDVVPVQVHAEMVGPGCEVEAQRELDDEPLAGLQRERVAPEPLRRRVESVVELLVAALDDDGKPRRTPACGESMPRAPRRGAARLRSR